MMQVTAVCNKGSGLIDGIKDHLRKHGKTYLVGLAILGAIAITAYARANIEESYMVRHGNSRTLQMIGAAPSIEEIDPTPYTIKALLKLSTPLPSN